MAGGWTQPEGGHFAKAGVRVLPGSTFFDGNGVTTSIRSAPYVDLSLDLYGEYGVSDEWTLVGEGTPFGFATVDGNGAPCAGLLQAGLRRRLAHGRHNVSLQVDAGITPPLGTADLFDASPVVAGRPYAYIPTQAGAQADVRLGYGLGMRSLWLGGQLGVGAFTHPDIAPAVSGHAQIGVQLPQNNRLACTLPFRWHTSGFANNVSGSGQSDYVGFNLAFDVSFGRSGWGAGVGGAGAFYATANEASPATVVWSATHTSDVP